jgi:N-acetylmuramoyl-L-alanine amidase
MKIMTKIHKNSIQPIIIFIIVAIFFKVTSLSAETESPAQEKYYQTAACYKDLRKNPMKQQYRNEWIHCIKTSEEIYKLDPNGSWATAGLYLTGHLYDRLYRHSKKKDDYQQAEQYFQKLLKRFPGSKYKERTLKALNELHTKNPIFADYNTECLRPKKKNITDVAKEKEARGKYFKAEHCYKNIPDNASESEWLRCIHRFHEVYQCDPDGRWAAAGLFQTAILTRELFHKTQKRQYADQSENVLKSILSHYPESIYCGKSADTLEQYFLQNPPEISSEPQMSYKPYKPIQKKKQKSLQSKDYVPFDREQDAGARDRYFRAENCYKHLIRSNSRHEEEWYACIAKFIDSYTFDPRGRWAAAALFRAGKLNQECYTRFLVIRYLNEAEDYFRRILNHFPESDYIEKTKKTIIAIQQLKKKAYQPVKSTKKKAIHRKQQTVQYQQIPDKQPDQQIPDKQPVKEANEPSQKTIVQKISWETKTAHTRIIVRTNQRVEYSQYLRKKENHIPECLFVDFEQAKLSPNVPVYFSINDERVTDLRILKKENQIRVVLELKNYHHYKIFSLKKPQRVIIDIWSQNKKKSRNTNGVNANSMKNVAIAKQLALGIRRIVIDAGHGGKDGGAVGFYKGVYEKDVVLAIARRLEQKIRQRIHCEVILTRSHDHFLPLEKRSEIANSNKADLFISIHTNAHPSQNVYGLETYYLNLTTDDDAIRVAALENEVSGKKMSDLDTILHDLMQNAKINESSRLAAYVQNSMFQHLKKYYKFIKDNGVKQAPFYVLMGAEMPAILIETGFISNQRDCRRLTNPAFQNHLCDAVVDGIENYIEETSMLKTY